MCASGLRITLQDVWVADYTIPDVGFGVTVVFGLGMRYTERTGRVANRR